MRLVTRGDMDGLVSSVLITTMEEISKIELVHPQQITDNTFVVLEDDILAKVPYHPSCFMWFSHREITENNLRPEGDFRGRNVITTSSSRVIHDYYSSPKLQRYEYLVQGADKFESAALSPEEVLDPQGLVLLGFLLDSRTGFGPFKVFFKTLVQRLKERDAGDVLKDDDVAERINAYRESQRAFMDQLKKHSRRKDNVVITDFRGLDTIPIGNRFLVYAAFPECNVSVRLQWGPNRNFVATTVGRSILNLSCTSHIGNICADFGGGGHAGAGSCPLEAETADEQVEEIVGILVADGV